MGHYSDTFVPQNTRPCHTCGTKLSISFLREGYKIMMTMMMMMMMIIMMVMITMMMIIPFISCTISKHKMII